MMTGFRRSIAAIYSSRSLPTKMVATAKTNWKIAVVIPCYNTGAACVDVITRARVVADAVLVVDDGSSDDTPEHIRSTAVPCLRLPANAGKGVALEAGMQEVLKGRHGRLGETFDAIVTIDGDGQHDPADVPRLVALAVREAADLVIGVRDVGAMPRKSKIGNYFARLFFFLGTGRYILDTQSGFRLYSRALAEALLPTVSWRRYETEAAILTRAVSLGYTVATVEIPTIYFDENRRTHFDPLRDSMRVIGVLSRDAIASLGVTAADILAFMMLLPLSGNVVRTNIVARAFAVSIHVVLTRADVLRIRGRITFPQALRYVVITVVSLAVTTWLLVVFQAWGMSAVTAKIVAQLTALFAFLLTFLVLDRFVFTGGREYGLLRAFITAHAPRRGT
jgi:glycosyltransferase involved in cell wall biosynthesis